MLLEKNHLIFSMLMYLCSCVVNDIERITYYYNICGIHNHNVLLLINSKNLFIEKFVLYRTDNVTFQIIHLNIRLGYN